MKNFEKKIQMKLFLALVGSSLGCGLYGPPPARVSKIIQI